MLGLLCAGPWAAALAAEAGVVVDVAGDTRLVRDGLLSSPLRPGAAVVSGDRLITGTDSRIELRLADQARIAIGPDSEFKLDDYQYENGRERSFLSLARGVMRQISGAIGKGDASHYRLTTPTGALAIRGTEFIVRETHCPAAKCPEGQFPGMWVSVIQGRVAVSNTAGQVEVPAGSTVRLDNTVTAPRFTSGPRAPASVAAADYEIALLARRQTWMPPAGVGTLHREAVSRGLVDSPSQAYPSPAGLGQAGVNGLLPGDSAMRAAQMAEDRPPAVPVQRRAPVDPPLVPVIP